MQDWYLWALLTGSAAITILARDVARAPLWIGMGALSFTASGWWHDAGLPYGAAFGAFTNFVVIAALAAFAVLLYELVFMACFIAMTGIELFYLTSLIISHHDYAVALEVANWIALLSVGAAGMADRAGIGLAWVAVFRTRPRWAVDVHGGFRASIAHLVGKPPA